jgi:hypothetical protein
VSDDYLWDRSGPPDPEIQELETALEGFRHPTSAPAFLDRIDGTAAARRRTFSLRIGRLAAAAALLIALGVTASLYVGRRGAAGD